MRFRVALELHNEILLHNYLSKQAKLNKNTKEIWTMTCRNWNHCALLEGVENGAATVEYNMVILHKIKNRTII
jgi:hypothetical protein